MGSSIGGSFLCFFLNHVFCITHNAPVIRSSVGSSVKGISFFVLWFFKVVFLTDIFCILRFLYITHNAPVIPSVRRIINRRGQAPAGRLTLTPAPRPRPALARFVTFPRDTICFLQIFPISGRIHKARLSSSSSSSLHRKFTFDPFCWKVAFYMT